MNIRHLHIFKTICDENSVSHAARKLYMTQPAVSHVLHDLEVELGYPLFDRIAKRLYLTQAGALFLERVRQIVSLYDELEREAKSFEKSAPIRIGSSITIANFWLPKILHEYHEQSEVMAQVNVNSASEILQLLKKKELDVAFMEGVIPQGEFIVYPFSSYRLCMVCSPDHPYARKTFSHILELKNAPFLLREKGSAIRDTFDSYLQLSALDIQPIWTSVNSQALLQAAKHTLGITILPEMIVEKDIKDKTLVEIKLKKFALKNMNHIVYHREKYISESMELLLSLSKQSCL